MVARDPGDQLEVLGELRQRLVAMVAVVSCLAGVVGWFVARRLVRPLIRLRDAARSISRTGDLTTPLVIDGSGEIRDLATSIDEMVQSLASSRAQQQRLVSDASHEMRTPLTSLTTNLDLLDRYGELSPDDRPEVVSAVRCDVDELTHLMTELVELATDRSSDEPVQLVDLADLATAVADRVRRRSGRVITLVVESEGLAVARPVMIERAIANLVDNAVKYSPATSPIEVRVEQSTVEVLDRGPGIPEELVDRIFERFYRTPEARGRPGSGLGLAIVQQAIERHGGTVWARPRDGGGLVVGFELPAQA
jgi:two-component system sensor histidine kinase MprB